MSLTKKDMIGTNQYEIAFSVAKDVFEAAVNAAYKKQVGKINVPGFRKGKAPRVIIEKLYGKGVFYDEALNACAPAAYAEAAKESGLDIVGQPEMDVESIDDEGVVLKAKVYVKPEVTLKEYKGLTAVKTVRPVTDAEVDAEVDRARERNSRTVDVTDRAAAMGDQVNIDFDGSVDGVPFEGGKSAGFDLKLGSGQFIPGFEEQVAGKKHGEEFDVNVTFPADYHAEELKGKAALFRCKLNSIKFTELPAADDEFAKDVSEFDTLAEYKADIRSKMEERNAKTADAEVEEQLMAELVENMSAEIPEVMFTAETENFVRDYDNRLRMQGLDLSTYFKYTGLDLDKLRAQMRPQAERQVKVRLCLEKIAALENLTASEEAIEGEYKRISETYNVPVEEVKNMIAAEDIAADMKVKAAMDFVKEHAVITEKAPDTAAEKPAKKPATKKAAADDAEKPAKKSATKKAADSEKPAKTTSKKKDAE